MRAYLRDAVHLLLERHRLVITGYFLEGRTSEELARFLAVTESRIPQPRSEAPSRCSAKRSRRNTVLRPMPAKCPPRATPAPQSASSRTRRRLPRSSSWKSRLDQVTTAEPFASLATA